LGAFIDFVQSNEYAKYKMAKEVRGFQSNEYAKYKMAKEVRGFGFH
jgi:hypothetical protein